MSSQHSDPQHNSNTPTSDRNDSTLALDMATESTPLLLPPKSDFGAGYTFANGEPNEINITEENLLPDTGREKPHGVAEGWYIVRKAIPVLLTYLMQYSLQIASVFSLGHLGKTELAAAALGSMYASVVGWSVALGAATALDTLCSQAWTSGNPKMVGVYLQRAAIILSIGFIPVGIIWWEAESILILFGQEPELSEKAGLFLKFLLIGAPAFLAFECLKKYLQAQGNMKASTYILIVCSVTNGILNYLLVWWKPLSLGFIGAPIATSITYWLMFILILLYVKFIDGYQAWGGWTRACLYDWSSFLVLAFPGILMVCAEWWAFELVALAAGILGEAPLASQSVVLTTACLVYQMPYGIAVSTSNRIGNLLGAGLANRAKAAAKTSLALAVLFGMVNSTFLYIFRNHLGYLFTEDKEVIMLVAGIIPLLIIFQVSDGIAAVGGGILRGQGRQKIGAVLNISGYYLVALPLGLILTFKLGIGLEGLWIGLTIASLLVGVGISYTVLTSDWQWEVEQCQQRIKIVDTKVKAASIATGLSEEDTISACSSSSRDDH